MQTTKMRSVKRLLKRFQKRYPKKYAILFQWHSSTRFFEAFEQTQSIFIHVPKTAGQSVAMALYKRGIAHMTWRHWYQRNPRKFASYFKFAVLRDPIARFCSAFDYLKAGGMNDRDKKFAAAVLKRFASVDEFATALADTELQQQVMPWWHFRPQAHFVADEFGRSKMDMLIRLEHLQTGVNQVARKLHLKVPVELPYLNQTPVRRPEELSEEARKILTELYRWDFALRDLATVPSVTVLNVILFLLGCAEWFDLGAATVGACLA